MTTDHWRADFTCYGSQWGYIPGSPVCNLIDYLREEHRCKYGCDYRLAHKKDNRYLVLPGKHGTYGVECAIEYGSQFGLAIEHA